MSTSPSVQIRDDVSIHGWPGTMGGITRRVTEGATTNKTGAKIVKVDADPAFTRLIADGKHWPKFGQWYNGLLASMGILEVDGVQKPTEPCDEDVRENDISLLPSPDATTQPILRAFEATTRSDPLTHKRIIVNPDIEMTEHLGIHLTYKCPKCSFSNTTNVSVDELINLASRDSRCKFKAPKAFAACSCGETEFTVTSGSRAVLNWFKVVVTIDNDLKRIQKYMGTTKTEIDNWISQEVNKPTGDSFIGNINPSLLDPEFTERIVKEMHTQYKYSMLGIILGVSDPGKPLELPSNMTGFKNPVQHWNKKRHVMTDLWWGVVQKMLAAAPECATPDCAICDRYRGEDWHDVAPHIGHCDVYGRFHAGTDIYSLSWIERMMVTASYWDELGNKDPLEVSKAKCSIGRACADVALGRDLDFDQRMAKQRCLLNLNTYTLRRALVESRFLASTGLGSFKVGAPEDMEQMIRGRLFEGMTLPYVEDDMTRRSCSDCADMIVLAAQLGIVFHDAIDLPNDIFNCEYMNVYRMAASAGLESLMKFTRGAHTLLKVMASTGSKSLCCGHVLQAALGNTVSWYFYCARYNYASNVQHVFSQEHTWKLNETDIEAANWVGRMLGCNEKTLALIKEWADLPLTSHADFGCGNKNPVQRFPVMRAACFDGKIVDADTAERESAEVFCTLAAAGRQHKRGERGNCLCCEVIWECVDMTVRTDMVGRFVHHALRLGTGKIEMVIDN